MRAIRRANLEPRVEMLPLIDVIFLLLTFFIYSLVLMVRAEILPVELEPLTTGRQAEPTEIEAITVDREGTVHLNRRPMSWDALRTRLESIGDRASQPTVYLALEATGRTDRGPVLLRLIELIRTAGVENFVLVGEGGENGDRN